MDKLVFLDIDDTLLKPPHKSLQIISKLLFIKNFPTEEQIAARHNVEYFKAFPEIFKSKNIMWAMAIASIPFGFVRCQKLFAEIDVKKLKEILSDPRVFLVTQNPPFLSRWRIKHLENLTGAKINGRYIACGPVVGKTQSKIKIIQAIAKLHQVELNNCLFVDDNAKIISEARSFGVGCRLVSANWNNIGGDCVRISHLMLCNEIVKFFGNLQKELPIKDVHFVFPEFTIFYQFYSVVIKIIHKFYLVYPFFIFSSSESIYKTLFLKTFQSLYWQKLQHKGRSLAGKRHLIVWTPYGFSLTFDPKIGHAPDDVVQSERTRARICEVYDIFDMPVRSNDVFLSTETYSKAELKERIEKELGRKVPEKDRNLFEEYTNEMLSSRSSFGVLAVYLFFSLVFRLIFRKIYVKKTESLKKIEKTHFIVYTPHHRSIYDSAMLMKVLGDEGCSMPIVPAAEKMRKNVVGFLGRFIGVFYIRRQQMTPLYYRIMNEVVKHALRFSASSAVFLEGQRSRSGLSLTPKAGVLKMILNNAGRIAMKPVVIVPISFAYNKLPESELLLGEVYAEMQAEKQITVQNFSDMLIHRTTSRITILKMVKKIFSRKITDAYITFGKPIYVNNENLDIGSYLNRIMIQKNNIVPPIATSVACVAILSAKKNHLLVADLVRFLNLSSLLIKIYPGGIYNDLVSSNGNDFVSELNGLPFINRKFKLHKITQVDIISITDIDTIIASHYLYNIIHYFSVPAVLAKLINRTNTGYLIDLKNVFARAIIGVCEKFFIDYSSCDLYFNKLIVLFSMMGAIEVDGGVYRYISQQESTPFAVLCAVAEVVNRQMPDMDLYQMSRRSERLVFNIPVQIEISDVESLVFGKLINISKTGGACQTNIYLREDQVIRIHFGNACDGNSQAAVVVRKLEEGFAFRFLSSAMPLAA